MFARVLATFLISVTFTWGQGYALTPPECSDLELKSNDGFKKLQLSFIVHSELQNVVCSKAFSTGTISEFQEFTWSLLVDPVNDNGTIQIVISGTATLFHLHPVHLQTIPLKLSPNLENGGITNLTGNYNFKLSDSKDIAIFTIENLPELRGSKLEVEFEYGIMWIDPLERAKQLKYDEWSSKSPWLVALYHKSSSGDLDFKCGGTLVKENVVVTAAHCVTDVSAHAVIVFLGRYRLDMWAEEDESQARTVSTIFIHPNYTNENGKKEADLAVLVLATPAVLGRKVQTIPMSSAADKDVVKLQDVAVVFGWGADEKGNIVTQTPFYVHTSIVSHEECLQSNPGFGLSGSMQGKFCAGQRDGSGPCSGDSGGGMYVREEKHDDVYDYSFEVIVLRGVVSFGLAGPDKKCDNSNYVVFTDVAAHRPWLETIFEKIVNPDVAVPSREQEAPPDQWPWLAVVYHRTVGGLRFVCTGALVSRNHVLADADCARVNASDLVVFLGRQHLMLWAELDDGQSRKVRDVTFLNENGKLAYDAAILQLSSPVSYNFKVKPVQLWDHTFYLGLPSRKALVTGWLHDQYTTTRTPWRLNMLIVEDKECPEMTTSGGNTFCATTNSSGATFCLEEKGQTIFSREWFADGKDRMIFRGVSNVRRDRQVTGECSQQMVFTDLARMASWVHGVISVQDKYRTGQNASDLEQLDRRAEKSWILKARRYLTELTNQWEIMDGLEYHLSSKIERLVRKNKKLEILVANSSPALLNSSQHLHAPSGSTSPGLITTPPEDLQRSSSPPRETNIFFSFLFFYVSGFFYFQA